ncbi:unnamed protein product [Rangifer tarandus platyrhynchus]|uniref:Uncharacterized protein n=1 Tax=Rangifer tarandus platyrhynchus TaxID=3082113 RepID=A0AC59YJG2_RANTA
MQDIWDSLLRQEDPLEKGMSTHSSVLAWRIPWTEEPGGLQSMGSQSRTPQLSDLYFHFSDPPVAPTLFRMEAKAFQWLRRPHPSRPLGPLGPCLVTWPPLCHSLAVASLPFLLLLEQTKLAQTSGPLHLLSSVPRMLFH